MKNVQANTPKQFPIVFGTAVTLYADDEVLPPSKLSVIFNRLQKKKFRIL